MGADHKGPLAAFVVIAIIAAVLLVTSVRSQADEGWLAVHRLVIGHGSSTAVSGSPTPAGVRQPAARPPTDPATAGGATQVPSSGATDVPRAPSRSGSTQRSAERPSTHRSASTTEGATPAEPPIPPTDQPPIPPGNSPYGVPSAPGVPVPTGRPGASTPLGSAPPAFGGGPDEPYPPLPGPAGPPDVSGGPHLGWSFERQHWFLGTWTGPRWLSLPHRVGRAGR